jgi:hypothetical protein
MKKCDVKGCKEKAVWFSKTESLCTFHYQDKVRESYERETSEYCDHRCQLCPSKAVCVGSPYRESEAKS